MRHSLLAISVLAGPICAQTSTFDIGFFANDDAMEVVPGAIIQAKSGGSGTRFIASSSGETGLATFSANESLTLLFEETQTSAALGSFQAVTIGQQFTLTPAALSEYIDSTVSYYFYQPKARLLTFSSTSGSIVSDYESGWFAAPHMDASGALGTFLGRRASDEGVDQPLFCLLYRVSHY